MNYRAIPRGVNLENRSLSDPAECGNTPAEVVLDRGPARGELKLICSNCRMALMASRALIGKKIDCPWCFIEIDVRGEGLRGK